MRKKHVNNFHLMLYICTVVVISIGIFNLDGDGLSMRNYQKKLLELLEKNNFKLIIPWPRRMGKSYQESKEHQDAFVKKLMQGKSPNGHD